MHPFYALSGVDEICIVVSRQETESHDIGPALKILESLLYDTETVQEFGGRLRIAFHGYDHDPRELYQISDVREYVAMLDRKFPYWFYFLSTDSEILKMLAFCMCRTSKVGTGTCSADPDDIRVFILTHFDANNKLFDSYNLDESINENISAFIADYFYWTASSSVTG